MQIKQQNDQKTHNWNTFTQHHLLLFPGTQSNDEIARIKRIEGRNICNMEILMNATKIRECLFTKAKEFLESGKD